VVVCRTDNPTPPVPTPIQGRYRGSRPGWA
jgi:hypothetical protein